MFRPCQGTHQRRFGWLVKHRVWSPGSWKCYIRLVYRRFMYFLLICSKDRNEPTASCFQENLFRSLKSLRSDRDMSTIHIATFLGAICSARLATLLWRVATCFVFLAHVWKWPNLIHEHPACRNYEVITDFSIHIFICLSQLCCQTRAICCAKQCYDILGLEMSHKFSNLMPEDTLQFSISVLATNGPNGSYPPDHCVFRIQNGWHERQ